MNFNKIMRAATAGVLALAVMASTGLYASAAEGDFLNPQPGDINAPGAAGTVNAQPGSKGGFYLYDANTGERVDESKVFTRGEALISSPSPTDAFAELNAPPRSVTGETAFTGVYRFISDKNAPAVAGGTNTWKSYAVDGTAGPDRGTMASDMTLEAINSNIEALITAGGSYWYGIAYTINNGVTTVGAVYREITIEAGTGNYTVSPMALETGVPPATTTTSLTSSASRVLPGETVELTATITVQNSSDAPAGTVQFLDGGVEIGAPTTVVEFNGVHSAKLVTPALTEGTHTFTAQFTGTPKASVSGEVIVNASNVSAPNPATINGSENSFAVSYDETAGTVTLSGLNNAPNFAWASFDGSVIELGPIAASATFPVPAGLAKGAAVQYLVSDVDGKILAVADSINPLESIDRNIQADVNATLFDGAFSLVDWADNDTAFVANAKVVNGQSVATGKLGEFGVIDRREVSRLGWTLNTNVTEFTHANKSDKIANSALGVAPILVDRTGGSGAAPALGAATAAGAASYQAIFAEQAAGSFTGEARFNADLEFKAPRGAQPGKYDGTLTLTLVSK